MNKFEDAPGSANPNTVLSGTAYILQRLHFRELAMTITRASFSKTAETVVLVDVICAYDGELRSDIAMRIQAYEFVFDAMSILWKQARSYRNTPVDRFFSAWLRDWDEKFGLEAFPIE